MTVTLFTTPSEAVEAPQKTFYPAMEDTLDTHNQHARDTFTQASQVSRAQVKAQAEADRKAEEKALAEAKAEAKALAEEKRKEVVVSRSTAVSSKAITFEATAYIALCDTGCTGKTAMGHDVRNTNYYKGYRVIAVDPKVIPLGSIVRVSYGSTSFEAIAWDTGGAIKGYRIDILVSTLREAKKFGRQKIAVEVLSK